MNVGPSDFYVGFGWQSFGLHIKGQWWPSGPFSCYYTAAWHQSCACTETFIVSVVIILWILFTQCLKHGWFTYKCISDQLFSYWNFAYSVRNRDGLLIYFWSIIVFLLLAFWLAWNSWVYVFISVNLAGQTSVLLSVRSFKLCLLITSIELDPFVQVLISLTYFLDHNNVRKIKMKVVFFSVHHYMYIFCFDPILSSVFVQWLHARTRQDHVQNAFLCIPRL